jgi:hypothetical protein
MSRNELAPPLYSLFQPYFDPCPFVILSVPGVDLP